MARNSQKPQGSSRIRLVVLEAEGDGDLSQIAQAVQSALRPREQIIAPPKRIASVAERTVSDTSDPEITDVEDDDDISAQEPLSSGASKPSKPRYFASPKVLEDVDLITEPSFASFATEKNPQTDKMRYLVVAAWFKEHRRLDSMNVNHMYTCFRAVRWPIPKGDFSQPLRSLKFHQLMTSPKRGEFAINHLGIAEVDKAGNGKN